MNLCNFPCKVRSRINHDVGDGAPLAKRSTMISGPHGKRVTGSR